MVSNCMVVIMLNKYPWQNVFRPWSSAICALEHSIELLTFLFYFEYRSSVSKRQGGALLLQNVY